MNNAIAREYISGTKVNEQLVHFFHHEYPVHLTYYLWRVGIGSIIILSAWQQTKNDYDGDASHGWIRCASACHDANIRSNRLHQLGAASMYMRITTQQSGRQQRGILIATVQNANEEQSCSFNTFRPKLPGSQSGTDGCP